MTRSRRKQDRASTAQEAQDDQVMSTNSSSIVSKRSVERLYYPNEPHFFRFFVKKFQRRAPLINRGYWLRLHVVDVAVRNFLRQPASRAKKVVVNLGCGSDVLPWQCLMRCPAHCRDVLFVDVDFPDLMRRKRQTVLDTPELRQVFDGLEAVDEDGSLVLLRSERYAHVGLDLRRVGDLQAALSSLVDVSACSFLFVAEVSITYMDTEGADGVIKWASSLADAEFCLLEQMLPDGPGHPFASTMLRHFDKLNTPLKSVHRYAGLDEQTERFRARGWTSARACTLWQAWADPAFVSSAERQALDAVEPFDEWEEFALFGSHYCLVSAMNEGAASRRAPVAWAAAPPTARGLAAVPEKAGVMGYAALPGAKGQRRFGAAARVYDRRIMHAMGLGNNNRLPTCDVFRPTRCDDDEDDDDDDDGLTFYPGGPSARMGHTLTTIGPVGCLLAGGRESPSKGLRDCWIFNPTMGTWARTHDLPVALYRHAVTQLGDSAWALLMGGKTTTTATFGGCLLFHPARGWLPCELEVDEASSDDYTPVSGAVFAWLRGETSPRRPSGEGIFAGGLKADGVISEQLFRWSLRWGQDTKKPIMSLSPLLRRPYLSPLFCRFGAACTYSAASGTLFILGGVVKDRLLEHNEEVVECGAPFIDEDGDAGSLHRHVYRVTFAAPHAPRPLLVGHSVAAAYDDTTHFLCVGGGATCFSMGTHWNRGVYTLAASNSHGAPGHAGLWELEQTVDIAPARQAGQDGIGRHGAPAAENVEVEVTPVPRLKCASAGHFSQLVRQARPVILEELDLGPCLSTWSLESLARKVGHDREVVVHEADSDVMDFKAKNFGYVTMGFAALADRVRQGDKLYLRALAGHRPAEKPAVLADDFPGLAGDFVLPPALDFVTAHLFSSVLRVSGPVTMWLHYDVMANVYCQIGGSKRMLLFPPSDVQHYFPLAPGASSSSVDVFAQLGAPALGGSHPHEAVLGPGDVLFLPPLWLHAATPLTSPGVAVNVFFRDLEHGYSAAKDVYGNRDLAPYERGRQDVAKIARSFQTLPVQVREFYLTRLADELRQGI